MVEVFQVQEDLVVLEVAVLLVQHLQELLGLQDKVMLVETDIQDHIFHMDMLLAEEVALVVLVVVERHLAVALEEMV